MKKILFVCHGNICRSVMAEMIMKQMVRQEGLAEQYYIDSAAVSQEEIGNRIYPAAATKLKEKGVPIEFHEARQVTRKDAQLFDHIYVMDESNMRLIRRIIPNNSDHKIQRLLPSEDVADPWYTGDFETTYTDLVKGCRRIFEETAYA